LIAVTDEVFITTINWWF